MMTVRHVVSGHLCLFDMSDFVKYSQYGMSVEVQVSKYKILRFASKELRGKVFARVLMNCPEGLQVDHIDGNSLNNCKYNLRLATPSQNQANVEGYASSGLKGAYKIKSGWMSKIVVNRKSIYLGTFLTKEMAAAAYVRAANKYFGEFSVTNSRSIR